MPRVSGRHALGGAADYLASYDFDGDLDARNNDGPEPGTLATDPAAVVNDYFTIPEALGRTYTFNPYR